MFFEKVQLFIMIILMLRDPHNLVDFLFDQNSMKPKSKVRNIFKRILNCLKIVDIKFC